MPVENLVVAAPVIAVARGQVVGVRRGFDDLARPLRLVCADVTGGAGQFGGDIQLGLGWFHSSWEAVLELCAGSAGLIAANTGNAVVDVHAVDASQIFEVQL